jgi:hypothetical protein
LLFKDGADKRTAVGVLLSLATGHKNISAAWPAVPGRTLLLRDNSSALNRGGRLGIIVTSKVHRRQLVPIFVKMTTAALERS